MSSTRLPQKRRIKELHNFSFTQVPEDSSIAKKRFCNLNLNDLTNKNHFNDSNNSNYTNNSVDDDSFQENSSRRKANKSISLTQVPANDTVYLSEHRCGKILSIHLSNFMCHENLYIDFGKRINFILGTNGSGKSAIMAALVLGLGGSARATYRSRSVKELIRLGQNIAKIEIVLSNSGPDAYEPHLFGNKIVVVRTITKTSSTYSIKNGRTGAVVYRRSQELLQILLYHNIQVDNPVFVLNQDCSREFLKQLEPKKNYILFMKATQIDLVTEKLNECVALHKTHIENLQAEEKALEQMEKELADLQKELEKLLSYANLKTKIKNCENECAWLRVQQIELDKSEITLRLQSIEEKINKLQLEMSSKEDFSANLKEQINNIKIQIDNKNTDYLQENTKLLDLKKRLSEVEGTFNNIQLEQKALRKKKQRITSDLSEITKYIDEESQKDQGKIDANKRENEAIIAKHRKRCNDDLKPIIEGLQRDLNLFTENKTQKLLIIEKIEADRKECSDNMRLLQHRMNSLKAGIRDKICIYGKYMPQLLNDIKTAVAAGTFEKLPLGPIGMYIELQNDKYRDVIEDTLGFDLLNGFIVSNRDDCRALENILSKYTDKMPLIITTKFIDKVYDVSKGCVTFVKGTTCALQVITCTHPVVMNAVIDRTGLETILLTDSKEIAERITSIRENIPKNLSKVILLLNGMLMEFYPQPRYRIYTKKCSKASFLQINIKQRIKDLEEENLELVKKIKVFDTDMKELQRQLPNDEKRIKEKRNMLQENLSELAILERDIKELENTEYADYNYEINSLIKEKGEMQSQIVDLEKKIEEINKNVEEAQKEVNVVQENVNAKLESMAVIMKEVQRLQAEEKKLQTDIMEFHNVKTHRCDTIKNLSKEQTTIQKSLSSLENLLQDAISKAKSLGGERITTERTEDEILLEIARFKAKLKYDTVQKYDQETLTKLIAEKKRDIEKNKSIYQNLKTSIYTLRRSLKYRFDFLKKFKGHMGMLMKMSFEMILALRDFIGEMVIDHKEKTLEINITPRSRKSKPDGQEINLKTLSGGERSYSTVAFLLSLWSCVDHPFYFLDEYDVYADGINREFMTRLLIEEGRKRPMSQYSFITPQLVNIESDENIKIHKLAKAV